MMGFGKRNDRPFPELLAAYADGELDAAARSKVEAWLTAHPNARTALDAQRRLSPRNRGLWRAAAAPNPGETNWARVFGRVQDALDAPQRPFPEPVRSRRRWSRLTVSAVSAAAAAAVVIGLLLSGADKTAGVAFVPSAANDAFVVATSADVDIISLDDRDSMALVVGQPPLAGPVVLASAGDVDLKHVQKDADGMMPKVQMNEAGLAPMIIAPIAGR